MHAFRDLISIISIPILGNLLRFHTDRCSAFDQEINKFGKGAYL